MMKMVIDDISKLNKCFHNDESIEEVIFKIPVDKIKENQFYCCGNLKKIIFEQEVGTISRGAFEDCDIEILEFKSKVHKIEKDAFSHNYNLKNVIFNNDVEIDENAFKACNISILYNDISNCIIIDRDDLLNKAYRHNLLIHEVKFTIAVKNIEDEMFLGCHNLRKVEFEYNVNTIGKSAFSDCNISQLIFHKYVKKICSNAFESNPLDYVFFNNDLEIEENAFKNCCSSLCFEIIHENGFACLKSYTNNNNIDLKWKGSRDVNRKKEVYLSIKDLTILLRKKLKFKSLLYNINLELNKGEMIMLMGGSGTGKTTLVKNVFGYDRLKQEGEILLHHSDETGMLSETFNRDIRKKYQNKFYYAPQFMISNEYLTVKQEIQRFSQLFNGIKLCNDELEVLLRNYALNNIQDILLRNISGGQRKKVALSCANLIDNEVYIFDEPDSGLDEPAVFDIFINDLSKTQVKKNGKLVIIISHHPHKYFMDYTNNLEFYFEDIFDKLIILAKMDDIKGSSIAFYGSPKEARLYFGLESSDPYSKIIALIEKQGPFYLEKWSRNQNEK